ncbi:hypothetical protein G9A89_000275 [Geosiphon pyriformis]|nr:hypothetical protein G9A89_000275 [Geosiphon pyriformis]
MTSKSPTTPNFPSNLASAFEWIENSILEGNIKYFDYTKFHSRKSLDNGTIGKAERAILTTWGVDMIYVLKILKPISQGNKVALKEFIKEMKFLREAEFFPNIQRFHGLSKTIKDGNTSYIFVLEYPNGGSLREYLASEFQNINGMDKLRMAQELVKGIGCLHEVKIIHRNLNSTNVLVHNKTIKISDIGILKNLNEIFRSVTEVQSQLAYVDPKCFKNPNYIRSEKSDIYALGVLLWELTSGHPPFKYNGKFTLISQIAAGKRESPIENTPTEYIKLYKECWDGLPENRPKIDQVIKRVEEIQRHSDPALFDYVIIPPTPKSDKSLVYCIDKTIISNVNNTSSISPFNSKVLLEDILNVINEALTIYPPAEISKIIPQMETLLADIGQSSVDFFKFLKINQNLSSNLAFLLGFSYQFGIGSVTDFKNSFLAYQICANKNNSLGQLFIGQCYWDGIGTEGSHETAFEWFMKSAQSGNSTAEFRLGFCYYNGDGVNKNLTTAVEWYTKAAEKGHTRAQFQLGKCYNDDKTSKNLEKAVEWYNKAATKGNLLAQNQLGSCYYNGDGVTKNFEKAVEWYTKSAESGNSSAQYNLGSCYQNGHGVNVNLEKAIELYTKAARNGYTKAQYILGWCYQNAHGVSKNLEKAVEWYAKAAKKENGKAQYNLGFCYYNGDGVSKNLDIGIEWFIKAAENGYSKAQYNLGCCYQKAHGVNQNLEVSIKWYTKAAEKGHVKAQFQLGFCYYNGEGVSKDREKAVSWFTKAAENGYSKAQHNLGWCYQNGNGVNKNVEKAVELYTKAAEKGNPKAQYSLGYCFQNGYGVPQSLEKGIEWYSKAAENGNTQAKFQLSILLQKWRPLL